MKKYALVILLLLVLIPNIISAKETNSSILLGDMKNFFDIGHGLITSPPFPHNCDEWTDVGLYASEMVLLFAMDKKLKTFALNGQTPLNDKIFSIDKYHGNRYSLLFSVGIYGYGYISKNNNIRKVGLQATEAFFYSGFISALVKIIISRKRPYASESSLNFKPIKPFIDTFQSLPSGHATISFAVSTVLAKSINNIYWKILCYGSSGIVATSRIYHNKHWVSDVFLGSVIGYKVADYVVNFEKEKNNKALTQHLYMGYNSIGLRFKF